MTPKEWWRDPYNWDMNDARHTSCPSDEDLAAYLEGALSPDDRALIESHAVICDDCRSAIATAVGAATLDDADSARPADQRGNARRRAGWLGRMGVLAAAAMVLLMLVRDARSPRGEQAVRASSSQNVAELHAVLPADEAELAAADLHFEWQPVQVADAVYVLTVSDQDGDMIWNVRTHAESWAPPADSVTMLPHGEPVYWRVEALLPDLSSAASGVRSFRLRIP